MMILTYILTFCIVFCFIQIIIQGFKMNTIEKQYKEAKRKQHQKQ